MAISQGRFRDDGSGTYLFIYRAMTQVDPRWYRAMDAGAECVVGPVKRQEGDRPSS